MHDQEGVEKRGELPTELGHAQIPGDVAVEHCLRQAEAGEPSWNRAAAVVAREQDRRTPVSAVDLKDRWVLVIEEGRAHGFGLGFVSRRRTSASFPTTAVPEAFPRHASVQSPEPFRVANTR